MIKVTEIRVPEGSGIDHVKKKVSHLIRVPESRIRDFTVLSRSVDARKKNEIFEVYSVSLCTDHEKKTVERCAGKNVTLMEEVRYSYPSGGRDRKQRPVVAGFGPAGIFASLLLAHAGYRPLVFERGRSIMERASDVEAFFRTGNLKTDSNVQFGEGGAGTFSDGKLNTGIKDRMGRQRFVLETFVRHGADEDILTSAHPHIGTDRLMGIIPSIRREIEELGGEIHFGSKITGIRTEQRNDGSIAICKVLIDDAEEVACDALFLCPGHSARDTFEMLYKCGVHMEAKPFAIGVRAEHTRQMIDKAMRQESASYKLTYHCKDGRGVYSFCMCPGGYVVNASSEEGGLTVNGMSYAARDGVNSNAAIVCTVTPEDYAAHCADALAGMRYQRELEKRAYEEGRGSIPYQRYEDFCSDRKSEAFGEVLPSCKGNYTMGNLRRILPSYICDDIMEAMPDFGRRIAGYDGKDTLFAGLEARTSSPVRIIRNEKMQSVSTAGLYPVGEGAGYAGGIMSAAIDGMKCAEQYISEE